MAKVKLSDAVRLDDGTITTCAKLLDSGRAVVTVSTNFHSRRGNTRTAYFCDLFDPSTNQTSGGWEISKFAYESRLDQSEDTRARASARAEEYSQETRLSRLVRAELTTMREGDSLHIMDWTVRRIGDKYDLGDGPYTYTLEETMEILT